MLKTVDVEEKMHCGKVIQKKEVCNACITFYQGQEWIKITLGNIHLEHKNSTAYFNLSILFQTFS